MQNSKFRIIIDFITYSFFLAFVSLLRIIGIEYSSFLIGKLLRFVGPFTKNGKIVRVNLKYIYPEKNEKSLKEIELDAWENFGRYAGEFPFIDQNFMSANKSRVSIKGLDKITELNKQNKHYILFSSHSANWEFVLYAMLKNTGDSSIIYRKINNRFIDQYVRRKRKILNVSMIQKGKEGAPELIKTIKSRKNILLLQDQKMNEGPLIPFLGKNARTSDSIPKIARQYNYVLVPVFVKRKPNSHFEIHVGDLIDYSNTDNKDNDIIEITTIMNDKISEWITKNPGEWLWQHQRWGKIHELDIEPKIK